MPADAISGSLKMTAGMQRDVDLGLVAGDDLGDHLGLVRGLVRQHRLAGDVADGVDAGHVGAQALVDGDEAALDLDADLVEAEALGVGAAADGDQDLVGLERRVLAAATLDGHGGAPALLGPGLGLGAGHHLDAQLLELARDHLDDLGIVARRGSPGSASTTVTLEPSLA